MPKLTLHGKKLGSMFELLGRDENDMTGSLGWVLANCHSFAAALLREVGLMGVEVAQAEVRLQQYETGRGFTDIEIEVPGKCCLIIEAKRGANLPTRRQLVRYTRRRQFRRYQFKSKRLVVISECNSDCASMRLGAYKGLGSQVLPLSWQEVATILKKSTTKASRSERRLLHGLTIYLQQATNAATKRIDSNWVYVVALGGKDQDSSISFIETVEKKRRYYHPAGPPWPPVPPTHIGFRYDGKLQSIHYIRKHEIVTNLGTRIPEVEDGEHGPMALYYLGPPFRPDHEVPTGDRIVRAIHVWCMLDTLFTCRTITEAWELSKKRGGRYQ
jgi:hypothetical protein